MDYNKDFEKTVSKTKLSTDTLTIILKNWLILVFPCKQNFIMNYNEAQMCAYLPICILSTSGHVFGIMQKRHHGSPQDLGQGKVMGSHRINLHQQPAGDHVIGIMKCSSCSFLHKAGDIGCGAGLKQTFLPLHI